VDIAAPVKGHLHGENGYRVEAAKTFDEIKPEDYDYSVAQILGSSS